MGRANEFCTAAIQWLRCDFPSVEVSKNPHPPISAVDKRCAITKHSALSNGNLGPPCVHPGDMLWCAAECLDSIILSFPLNCIIINFFVLSPYSLDSPGEKLKGQP